MTQTVVGVIRGGTSNEYDLSLKTGAAVMQALPEEAYHVRDILIDKSGSWHMNGRPVEPIRVLSGVDAIFNALHGGVGEDGTVARIIHRAGIPHSGGKSDAQLRSFNKTHTRSTLAREGVRMPRAIGLTLDPDVAMHDIARLVFSQFGPPYVLKPAAAGFSIGVTYVPTIENLSEALYELYPYYNDVVIEEFIRGREVTVGVIDNFRNTDTYALPPAEVLCNDEGVCITTRAWRESLLHTTCPVESATVVEHKNAIIDVARRAHRALGLSGYSSVDFIVTSRGPYLLEVDALPPLYEGMPMPIALDAVGSSLSELVQHTIAHARREL